MALAANTHSSPIVLELLRKDNYENWRAWMKNYLLAQDLWWGIVEATTKPPKQDQAWRKNNAAALHAILISCEVDILPEIRKITSAKIVWNKLASMYGPDNSSSCPRSDLEFLSRSVSEFLSNNILGNLPAGDHRVHLDEYKPLRKAIERCNWDDINGFLSLHEDAKSARISIEGFTILHAAVWAGCTEIVAKIVDLMSAEELEITDYVTGGTALNYAAFLQNTGMVDCMLRKNKNLLNIPDLMGCIPLEKALQHGINLKLARHLYSVSLTSQPLSDIHASTVLFHFIDRNNFDLALHLHHRCPASAIVPNIYNSTALKKLASNPSAFPSGNQLVFWKSWIYACIPNIRLAHSSNEIQIEIDNPNQHRNDVLNVGRSVLGLLRRLPLDLLKLLGIKQIYEMKLRHHQAHQLLLQMSSQVKQMRRDRVRDAVFLAVRSGIVEFIDEILKADDTLVVVADGMGRGIMYHAVLHRQAKVYRRIYEIFKNNWTKQVGLKDRSGNTLLHMTAMLEPSTPRDRIAGEALQMQSELQWFKEVERIHFSVDENETNDANMTAKEFFTHNHMDMMKKGEKWMKATATSSTVVGALIITIMFTAAFTVPGGNNQNTGFPMFSNEKLFTLFILSDALSLISASTSVLVFLSILTSRYEEEDFRQSLPTKMIIGLFTLFFSITTMMIAFCVGLYITLPEKSSVVIPAICLASVTVIQFGFMQIPLLVDMLTLTIKVWTGSLW